MVVTEQKWDGMGTRGVINPISRCGASKEAQLLLHKREYFYIL
jgi:hypothetical protein